MQAPDITPVTAATFQREVLDAPIPVIIDFTAAWCGPCRQLAPVLAELARAHAGAVKVVSVDADTEPALAVQFGVRGLPTLAVVTGGRHVDGMRGFSGRRAVAALFDKHAAPSPAP